MWYVKAKSFILKKAISHILPPSFDFPFFFSYFPDHSLNHFSEFPLKCPVYKALYTRKMLGEPKEVTETEAFALSKVTSFRFHFLFSQYPVLPPIGYSGLPLDGGPIPTLFLEMSHGSFWLQFRVFYVLNLTCFGLFQPVLTASCTSRVPQIRCLTVIRLRLIAICNTLGSGIFLVI